jgi:hypothetical protein
VSDGWSDPSLTLRALTLPSIASHRLPRVPRRGRLTPGNRTRRPGKCPSSDDLSSRKLCGSHSARSVLARRSDAIPQRTCPTGGHIGWIAAHLAGCLAKPLGGAVLMPDETMRWDESPLEYGYVLDRTSDRGWWHLHFGRSGWSYDCELLGRRTNVLACLQLFALGGVVRSPRFFLTLDGEGVGSAAEEARLVYTWGSRPEDAGLVGEARRFQQEVMPRLYDSPAFQQAAAKIVARQQHLRMAVPGKLSRAEPGAATEQPRD